MLKVDKGSGFFYLEENQNSDEEHYDANPVYHARFPVDGTVVTNYHES